MLFSLSVAKSSITCREIGSHLKRSCYKHEPDRRRLIRTPDVTKAQAQDVELNQGREDTLYECGTFHIKDAVRAKCHPGNGDLVNQLGEPCYQRHSVLPITWHRTRRPGGCSVYPEVRVADFGELEERNRCWMLFLDRANTAN